MSSFIKCVCERDGDNLCVRVWIYLLPLIDLGVNLKQMSFVVCLAMLGWSIPRVATYDSRIIQCEINDKRTATSRPVPNKTKVAQRWTTICGSSTSNKWYSPIQFGQIKKWPHIATSQNKKEQLINRRPAPRRPCDDSLIKKYVLVPTPPINALAFYVERIGSLCWALITETQLLTRGFTFNRV